MRSAPTPIVGRDAELADLSDLLRAARSGAGQAAFLIGDGGIGKSRLADESGRIAGDLGMPVLRGRSGSAGQQIPYRPLIEAVSSRQRLHGLPDDFRSEPWRSALARLIPAWRTDSGPDTAPSLAETSEALLRLLMALGRDNGCLLVLEDLHAADPETIAVIDYLVDNIAGSSMLLVGTIRPAGRSALGMARSAGRRRAARVFDLPALTPAQVRAVAAACLPGTAEDLPEAAAAHLTRDSGGNPYYVEELVAAMVSSGALRRDASGWTVAGDLGASLPAAIVEDHAYQLDRLPAPVRDVVLTAAVLGARFTGAVLRTALGIDEESLLRHVQTLTKANLVVPEAQVPDGYAFRHELTAKALLATLLPAQRTHLARNAAVAVQRAGPELPPEHRRLVADLYQLAGDAPAAAGHYALAGRRALADGATASAAALLELAHRLAAPPDRVGIAGSLILALAEAGQLDQAVRLLQTAATTPDGPLSADRRRDLYARLAWLAMVAGRTADSRAHLAQATAPAGEPPHPEPSTELTARLAVTRAHLALSDGEGGGPQRVAEATRLAERAVEIAERAALPVVACQAWELLAVLARGRGFDVADTYLRRILATADAHGLLSWRVEALLRMGINMSLRTGDGAQLVQARQAAWQLGAIVLGHTADAVLAFNAVLRGDHPQAREIVDRTVGATARLGNVGNHLHLLLTSAMTQAHRGRRTEMERELHAFRRLGGEASALAAVQLGMCRAVCALLEEDRDRAAAALAAALAWEVEHPSGFYLAGRYGLGPLLDALAGRLEWADYRELADAPGAALRWNRQFLLLTHAVLAGRAGRAAEAVTAVATAQEAAERFPMARHLGLRLVAEAALRDHWGEPVTWLRAAEEHFHTTGIPAPAMACRALLRAAGASVWQHRDGRHRIPAELRREGVTAREYEVFRLLAECPGNADIAQRLHISRRTVEKHIANLLAKIGVDRSALSALSAAQPH